MKKLLLIALAVLSVCMLVGCNASGISEKEAEERTQAKLDEAADTYGEFLKYKELLENKIWFYVQQQIGAYTTTPLDNADLTGFDNYKVGYLVKCLYGTTDYKIDSQSSGCSFVGGKCSGLYTDATISNVKMKASYDIISREDYETVIKEVKDEEITISEGSFKQTINEDESVSTTSIKTTINDVGYSLEYTYTAGKLTSASVNGKQVAAKFLEAKNTYGTEEWY